jgi:hypothetical protein
VDGAKHGRFSVTSGVGLCCTGGFIEFREVAGNGVAG